jgi:Mn-dependent DtxR family transcriptional regulator
MGRVVSERSACPEGERLGQEYGDLMLSHVTLEEKFISAKLRHDHELATALARQMHHLASERARMRHAMRHHGNKEHPH